MKTKSLLIALSVIFALGLSFPIDVLANGHRPPAWAPAHGFRTQTRQVYFPKYNCYYDVVRGNYIYNNNGRWIVSVNLPIHYRQDYFRNASYVELNINSRYPYYFNAEHRVRYNVNNDYYNNKNRHYRNEDRDRDRGRYKENKHWKKEKKHKGHHGHD